MPKNVLTLVLDGSPARNGNIPADVFVAKIRQFITTVYSFDRSYTSRPKRALDLEIFDLRRVNPALVCFNPRPIVSGYNVSTAVGWTMDQLKRLSTNEIADPRVSQDALDNVIDLATVRKTKVPPLSSIRVRYDESEVRLDESIIGHAMAQRQSRRLEVSQIWKAGVSRGSIFGELRAVSDLDGEKTFFIVSPNGRRTQCVFQEELRQSIQENLWRPVHVFGFLRYDGEHPKPYLIDAERIEPVTLRKGQPHLLDMRGAFKDYDEADFDELV